MFENIDTLEGDLTQFSDGGFVLPLPFRLVSSEVGKAVIQLAGGKTPEPLSHLAMSDGTARPDMQKSASRFVASIMLSPVCNHFTTLGVAPDFEASALRDNFRRLMALVHPDARPVGFPDDAASRVNRAYAVLSDTSARETYTALEMGHPTLGSLAPLRTTQSNSGRTSTAPGKPPRSRLLGWASALRARQSLLWIAAVLLVPLGMAVLSFFSSNEPQRLVEARPRLTPSLDITNSRVDATAAQSSAAAPATDTERQLVVESATVASKSSTNKLSVPDRQTAPTEVAASANQPHPVMTAQLSARSIEISSRQSMNRPASLAPSPSIVSVGSQSRAATAVESASTQRAQDTPPQPPVQSPQPTTATQPLAAGEAVAASSVSAKRIAATGDKNDSAQKVKAVDADELVVRFSNAYESGSIAAFGQLLAPGLSNRRQMLNDYERVFQSTRQRSIKFKQLKHAANGERISTTGYATVTTVDQENRTVVQRVFLEFEIGRDRGESRIERLANYVIN